MAFYGQITEATRKRIIDREQTGTASEMTLPEQIEHYDGEIKKIKGWIGFYKSPRMTKRYSTEWLDKTIAVYQKTLDCMEMKREIALAKLYAEDIPFHGGVMTFAVREGGD